MSTVNIPEGPLRILLAAVEESDGLKTKALRDPELMGAIHALRHAVPEGAWEKQRSDRRLARDYSQIMVTRHPPGHDCTLCRAAQGDIRALDDVREKIREFWP
jgi:hypothetical protein